MKCYISPHDRCGAISDFSTFVMYRNLKLFHMTDFLYISHLCELCDKYEVCQANSCRWTKRLPALFSTSLRGCDKNCSWEISSESVWFVFCRRFRRSWSWSLTERRENCCKDWLERIKMLRTNFKNIFWEKYFERMECGFVEKNLLWAVSQKYAPGQ